MSSRTTRAAARSRVLKVLTGAVDRIIPADESIPLKGGRFVDFEDQVEELVRTVVPVMLEERTALQAGVRGEALGRCPHCGSDRLYLKRESTQGEIISPHGPVVLAKQHVRCRACKGSFSPSAP